MEHVVIQDPHQTYGNINSLDILCRCRKTKHPPYERVAAGDVVYIQQKGGMITAKATVSSVISKPYNDVNEIRELCKSSSLYNAFDYWKEQRNRCYGTVVRLTNQTMVKPPRARKYVKGNANDWIVLDSNEKRRQWEGM